MALCCCIAAQRLKFAATRPNRTGQYRAFGVLHELQPLISSSARDRVPPTESLWPLRYFVAVGDDIGAEPKSGAARTELAKVLSRRGACVTVIKVIYRPQIRERMIRFEALDEQHPRRRRDRTGFNRVR